jgi:50S ribosomal subunit-associated GTPase HflX
VEYVRGRGKGKTTGVEATRGSGECKIERRRCATKMCYIKNEIGEVGRRSLKSTPSRRKKEREWQSERGGKLFSLDVADEGPMLLRGDGN